MGKRRTGWVEETRANTLIGAAEEEAELEDKEELEENCHNFVDVLYGCPYLTIFLFQLLSLSVICKLKSADNCH